MQNKTWKEKIDQFLKLFVVIDIFVLILNFIHSRFQIDFFLPAPGSRLNNPLGALLIAFFLRGLVNCRFRERWLGLIRRLVIQKPHRNYFFGALILTIFFLEWMFFLYPKELFWNLNAEQGYGTYFSTIQLFLLGLVVIIVCKEKNDLSPRQKLPWHMVSGLYFYLTLDEVLGIHDRVIIYFQKVAPHSSTFHLVHEWLWIYAPFIIVAVILLTGFFIRWFKNEPLVIGIFAAGLSLWISSIFLEGLSKKVLGPMGYILLSHGLEEGAEMLGATLFLFGFSCHLRNSFRKNEKI